MNVAGCYDVFYDQENITASIHKDPRGKSPFWYCAYRLPNGKRAFRSTKLTERKAADEFCRRLEYASHESKAGRLTEPRAHELISEIVEQATGEPLRNYTAEEWLCEWLQGKNATKTEGTFLKYENAIDNFLDSLGQRAKFNVNQIASRDIFRFRDAEMLTGSPLVQQMIASRLCEWRSRRRADRD